MRLPRWQAAGQGYPFSVKWKQHALFLGERAQIRLLRSQVHQHVTLQRWRPLSARNQVRGHCHSTCTPPKAYYPSSRCQEGWNLKEDGLGMAKESATAATARCSCRVGREQRASERASCPLRHRLTGPTLSATSKRTADVWKGLSAGVSAACPQAGRQAQQRAVPNRCLAGDRTRKSPALPSGMTFPQTSQEEQTNPYT